MIDEDIHKSIGELKARCMFLESRVAALTAFACAILEPNAKRDELQTRWANHLGPAVQQFSELGEEQIAAASALPGWVQYRLEGNSD